MATTAISNAQCGSNISRKLQTREWCNSIDILSERQNLEISPKHFWMQERLQRALRLCIGIALRDVVGQLGNYPGDEMMLIGEAFDFETARFRTLDNTRPFDMRGDIGVADLIEWRLQQTMLRADLQCPRRSMRREKFVMRIAVINREHVTAIEFAR